MAVSVSTVSSDPLHDRRKDRSSAVLFSPFPWRDCDHCRGIGGVLLLGGSRVCFRKEGSILGNPSAPSLQEEGNGGRFVVVHIHLADDNRIWGHYADKRVS